MGVVERRAREKEAVRQSILDAALEIMVAEGFEGLSLRRIAEKIEYAPSTIYLYFKDKVEIVDTLCADVFRAMADALTQATSSVEDPVECLRRGLRCYVDFGTAHPAQYVILLCQPLPEIHSTEPTDGSEAGMRCFQILVDAVQAGIDAGRLRQAPVQLVSQSLWVSLHGLTSLMITHSRDPHFPWVDRETLIQNNLNMILRGVLTHPEELPFPIQ